MAKTYRANRTRDTRTADWRRLHDERLALREHQQEIEQALRCTGGYDDLGRFGHDGDTCPIHEKGN